MAYAIKVHVADIDREQFCFKDQKTMYGGKQIAENDTVFIFDSENEGGSGLFAKGVVTAAAATPRQPDKLRQTPRVSIAIRRQSIAVRRLGRSELKPFSKWDDQRPETELNFMLYRQATNKIVRLSDPATAFLQQFFDS